MDTNTNGISFRASNGNLFNNILTNASDDFIVQNLKNNENLRLRAGNVIKVEIERQGDNKELGGLDEHTSGKYLILHLCHHFDTERSFTSMTLARDTYGLHVKDEGNSNEQLKKESGLIFN